MTIYRLYLRTCIRRELLSLGQTAHDPQPLQSSYVGRKECPSMVCGDHRYSYVITGREEFEAENDVAAVAIARSVFDAAGDLCEAFELWDGPRQIDERRTATQQTNVITAQRQEQVIRAEETLLSSGWAIAHSRRLLARVDQLREEAARGLALSPTATPN